ncbi:MAG: hypothetical protein JO004_01160 [Methylobacteriaceae bacterium]|nr:hypothetical protein [Methylobacteriaceae bacterium]
MGAELVRFDEALQAFVRAELPVHFGQARDPVRTLLTKTSAIRVPFSKRRVIRRMDLLGELLSKAWPIVPETEREAACEELAWELAHNYKFLPVAKRFELTSLAHAFEPDLLCHDFRYWVTVERKRIESQDNGPPEFAQRIDLRSGDKASVLGHNLE